MKARSVIPFEMYKAMFGRNGLVTPSLTVLLAGYTRYTENKLQEFQLEEFKYWRN